MPKTVNSQYSVSQTAFGGNQPTTTATHSLPPLIPRPPILPHIYKKPHFPKLFDHPSINTPLLALFIFFFPSQKNKAHLRFGCDNCPRFASRKTAAFSTETAAPPPPPPLRRVRGGRGGARHESGAGSRALGVM